MAKGITATCPRAQEFPKIVAFMHSALIRMLPCEHLYSHLSLLLES